MTKNEFVDRVAAGTGLSKKDAGSAISEAVQPIVYYLDRGAPEPVRSALLDGARWWNQAFEAAGFRNAFRVELMPEDADPEELAEDAEPDAEADFDADA